jgi:hypothetical protein
LEALLTFIINFHQSENESMAKSKNKGMLATRRIEYGEAEAQGKVSVKVFEPGDVVAMSDQHLQPLLALGAVVDSGAAEDAVPAA